MTTADAILLFRDGKGSFTRRYSIAYLNEEYQEVYDEITSLLKTVKNAADVTSDIEMGKIDVWRDVADALAGRSENAENEREDDYISELKGLKELLDNGIITQTEFDEKKREILS